MDTPGIPFCDLLWQIYCAVCCPFMITKYLKEENNYTAIMSKFNTMTFRLKGYLYQTFTLDRDTSSWINHQVLAKLMLE